jgi:hypothetical protein
MMRGGPAAMPDDLTELHHCLSRVAEILAEKAVEREPSWTLALGSAAEIDTLLELEAAIARKAAELPGRSLQAVLDKLAIWHLLARGDDDSDEHSLRRPLVLSVIADLQRIVRREPAQA